MTFLLSEYVESIFCPEKKFLNIFVSATERKSIEAILDTFLVSTNIHVRGGTFGINNFDFKFRLIDEEFFTINESIEANVYDLFKFSLRRHLEADNYIFATILVVQCVEDIERMLKKIEAIDTIENFLDIKCPICIIFDGNKSSDINRKSFKEYIDENKDNIYTFSSFGPNILHPDVKNFEDLEGSVFHFLRCDMMIFLHKILNLNSEDLDSYIRSLTTFNYLKNSLFRRQKNDNIKKHRLDFNAKFMGDLFSHSGHYAIALKCYRASLELNENHNNNLKKLLIDEDMLYIQELEPHIVTSKILLNIREIINISDTEALFSFYRLLYYFKSKPNFESHRLILNEIELFEVLKQNCISNTIFINQLFLNSLDSNNELFYTLKIFHYYNMVQFFMSNDCTDEAIDIFERCLKIINYEKSWSFLGTYIKMFISLIFQNKLNDKEKAISILQESFSDLTKFSKLTKRYQEQIFYNFSFLVQNVENKFVNEDLNIFGIYDYQISFIQDGEKLLISDNNSNSLSIKSHSGCSKALIHLQKETEYELLLWMKNMTKIDLNVSNARIQFQSNDQVNHSIIRKIDSSCAFPIENSLFWRISFPIHSQTTTTFDMNRMEYSIDLNTDFSHKIHQRASFSLLPKIVFVESCPTVKVCFLQEHHKYIFVGAKHKFNFRIMNLSRITSVSFTFNFHIISNEDQLIKFGYSDQLFIDKSGEFSLQIDYKPEGIDGPHKIIFYPSGVNSQFFAIKPIQSNVLCLNIIDCEIIDVSRIKGFNSVFCLTILLKRTNVHNSIVKVTETYLQFKNNKRKELEILNNFNNSSISMDNNTRNLLLQYTFEMNDIVVDESSSLLFKYTCDYENERLFIDHTESLHKFFKEKAAFVDVDRLMDLCQDPSFSSPLAVFNANIILSYNDQKIAKILGKNFFNYEPELQFVNKSVIAVEIIITFRKDSLSITNYPRQNEFRLTLQANQSKNMKFPPITLQYNPAINLNSFIDVKCRFVNSKILWATRVTDSQNIDSFSFIQ
ncbi:MAG: hypothetical protein MHMPM18_001482 [Marteilia pararefringens]